VSKFEVAVGQVWTAEDGDEIDIVAVGENNLCARYSDGDLGTFKENDEGGLRENYQLSRHQCGADIDESKYTYEHPKESYKVEAPLEWWNEVRKQWITSDWIDCGLLWRTPKVTKEPELPYVDIPVQAWPSLGYSLGYTPHPDGEPVLLTHAPNSPAFIGYVYDGDEFWMSPRRHGGKDKPAQTPKAVRFAQEVAK